jgi:trimeric autotransporter adhesin
MEQIPKDPDPQIEVDKLEQQAAAALGMSVAGIRKLKSQGINIYTAKDITQLSTRHNTTISAAAAEINGELQRETISGLGRLRKVFLAAGMTLLGYLSLVCLFAFLFTLFPVQTANWLGYVSTTAPPTTSEADGRVLAATTVPAETLEPQPSPQFYQTILQPISRLSLDLVKTLNPNSYSQVADVTILDPNQILQVGDGTLTPLVPIKLPSSAYLQVPDSSQVNNLNSQYLQGRRPGTNAGDIAIVGETGAGDLTTTVPSTSPTSTPSATPSSNPAPSPSPGNITINTATPISGGGTVSLGSSLTLTCPTCSSLVPSGTSAGNYGNATTIPTYTVDVFGRLTASGNTTIAGLNTSNLAAGAGIMNTQLANSDVTLTSGLGLTNGGSVSLGGTMAINVGAGSGITVNADDIAINLATSGTTGATSSNSGLEIVGSSLTLLHGCADNEILKWTDAGGWTCTPDADTLASLQIAYGNGNTITTTTGTNIAFTLAAGLVSPTSFTLNNNGSADAFVLTNTSTATNGLLIDHTTGGTLTNALNITGSAGTTTHGLIFNGTIGTDIATAAARALAIESGTTGSIIIGADTSAESISLGTGTAAKTLVLGSTNTSSITTIQSGSGNINLQVSGTGTTGTVQIGAGGAGSGTPDLFKLDIKSTAGDPTGTNGAMYYNASLNKFRCFENAAWTNCISSTGTNLQHAAIYDTNEAVVNVVAAQTVLGTVSVTPTTATGDVFVTGQTDVYSSNAIDQPFTLVIETTANCTGTTVGNATVTYTITSGASAANDRGSLIVSGIAINPGASAQTYSLCASTPAGDTDVLNWRLEALVIDTGADVAEIYTSHDPTLDPGDVVAYDPSLATGVQKAQTEYDQATLGVITTHPGLVIGNVDAEGEVALPVALAGRVPVKVSTINGTIHTGDYLTSSSIPGVAMKATQSGAMIGIALDEYSEPEVGSILMFIKTSSAYIPSEPVNASPPTLSELVEFLSKVIFRNDVTFAGRVTFDQDTAGYITIASGESEAQVVFVREYVGLPAVTANVTLTGDVSLDTIPASAIYDVSPTGFKIKLASPTPVDLSFAWIALSVDTGVN